MISHSNAFEYQKEKKSLEEKDNNNDFNNTMTTLMKNPHWHLAPGKNKTIPRSVP